MRSLRNFRRLRELSLVFNAAGTAGTAAQLAQFPMAARTISVSNDAGTAVAGLLSISIPSEQ